MGAPVGHLGKPIVVVALANIALAATALVRESRLAAFAGTTEVADAFLLALYLVDLAANTVLAGGMVFAAVPVLAGYNARGSREGFERALQAAVGVVLALSVALSLAGWLVAPAVTGSVGAGLAAKTRSLAGSLFRCLLPSIPCFALSALASSALYALRRFAPPAFGPVVSNLVFLVGIFLAPALGVRVPAISFSAGAAAMLLVQLPALLRSRLVRMPRLDWRDPGLADMVRRSWPAMAGILLAQLGGVAERVLAGGLAPGSIAGLSYAFKLSQFPVWVFSAAIGTVLFPMLATSSGQGDLSSFKAMLARGLGLTVLICVPFSVIFLTLAEPVVSLLFQYGSFDARSLGLTSRVLRTYALGLGAQGLAYLFVRALYSLGDATTPMKAAAGSAMIAVASDIVLVGKWGLPGLGLGASMGAAVHAVTLGWVLRRKTGPFGRMVVGFVWRVCVASALLAGVILVLGGAVLDDIGGLPFPTRALRVGLTIAAGGVVYLAACYALGLKEFVAARAAIATPSVAPRIPRPDHGGTWQV